MQVWKGWDKVSYDYITIVVDSFECLLSGAGFQTSRTYISKFEGPHISIWFLIKQTHFLTPIPNTAFISVIVGNLGLKEMTMLWVVETNAWNTYLFFGWVKSWKVCLKKFLAIFQWQRSAMKGIFDQRFLVVDLLEMLGNGKKYFPKGWFDGDLPWYKVKIHRKP